ncbi:MAG: pilus assembly protein [Oscillospiraceae bacterium]|jgi:hypothetical protein|nr:pilus assembly protein [Oscillospiraceae bacterium]
MGPARAGGERGFVAIEAAMVFPVLFLVVFFLLFLGNAYYSKCKAEAAARRVAIAGAAYFADSELPYRYLTGADLADGAAGDMLSEATGAIGTGLFSGMDPKLLEYDIELDNMFICAAVSVDLTYSIPIPVRLFGADGAFSMRVSVRAEAPVPDAPEFIRNINMAEDYILQTGADDKLKVAFDGARRLIGGD